VPYASAKAGLNAMTVAMADALGPTVRVNCVVRGLFRTDVVEHWDEATMRGAAERPALKRIGEPDEIVGAVLYFASDASSYTTARSSGRRRRRVSATVVVTVRRRAWVRRPSTASNETVTPSSASMSATPTSSATWARGWPDERGRGGPSAR